MTILGQDKVVVIKSAVCQPVGVSGAKSPDQVQGLLCTPSRRRIWLLEKNRVCGKTVRERGVSEARQSILVKLYSLQFRQDGTSGGAQAFFQQFQSMLAERLKRWST